MSNLPISSKYRSQPDLPVSDAERDDLTRRLNAAFERGDVSQDDYRALLDRLYAARTLGELVPVVEQAAVRETHNSPAIVAQQTALEPGQVNETSGGMELAKMTMYGWMALAGVLVIMLVLLAM